jgi:hypothetical protein
MVNCAGLPCLQQPLLRHNKQQVRKQPHLTRNRSLINPRPQAPLMLGYALSGLGYKRSISKAHTIVMASISIGTGLTTRVFITSSMFCTA